MSVVTIRAMTANDWLHYKSIRLRALADSPDAFASTLQAEQEHADELWLQRLQTAAVSAADLPLFAIADDVPIGLVWAKAGNADPHVISIFQLCGLDPKFRGHGVGRQLLETLLGWSRARGASKVVLGITDGDSPALQLYRSAGFEVFGQSEPLREGSDLLSLTMRLCLDST